MKGKESFKISWVDDEEVFLVQCLYGKEVVEETKFKFCIEAYEYIVDYMQMSQIAGETWTLTYDY